MVPPDDPNPYEPPRFNVPSGDVPQGGPTNEKLVVLSTFNDPTEAHLFRNELEKHGIHARVGNEASTALGFTLNGQSSAFWIEVIVLESEAEKALEIKQHWSQAHKADEADIPEWACTCGETVDAGFACCWSCGAPFESDA